MLFTVDFPSGVLEAKDAEIVEYISPKDLMVGQTIPMLARRLGSFFFLIYKYARRSVQHL